MIVTPITEGIVNAVASIMLGLKYGAIGVAFGTLIGSGVGFVAVVIQHPLKLAFAPYGMSDIS